MKLEHLLEPLFTKEPPKTKAILREIRGNPVYQRFIWLIKSYDLWLVYDFHAHISSGRSDFREDATREDIAELPKFSFTIADLAEFYRSVFWLENITARAVVFDTPLHGYDMAKKNNELLTETSQLAPEDSASLIPFVVITPEMGKAELDKYIERGAKGFKVSPRTAPAYYMGRKRIYDVRLSEMLTSNTLDVANSYKLPVVVHLPQSVSSPRMSDKIKDGITEIVMSYPATKLVLAHLALSQTPAKIDDTVSWIERNRLEDMVYLDISAVTIPSVLEIALSSTAKLLFGTDIDFSLAERGRYIVLKPSGGAWVLAGEEERRGTKTVLVSTSFGSKYKQMVLGSGVQIDLPVFLFQLEGIVRAVEKLSAGDKERTNDKLHGLFWRNAEALLKVGV